MFSVVQADWKIRFFVLKGPQDTRLACGPALSGVRVPAMPNLTFHGKVNDVAEALTAAVATRTLFGRDRIEVPTDTLLTNRLLLQPSNENSTATRPGAIARHPRIKQSSTRMAMHGLDPYTTTVSPSAQISSTTRLRPPRSSSTTRRSQGRRPRLDLAAAGQPRRTVTRCIAFANLRAPPQRMADLGMSESEKGRI